MSSATTIEPRGVSAEKASALTRPDTKSAEESHWRSVAKAISWRAVGTVDTIVISFLVTGKVKLAVSIGCVELFTKVCLFYLHERAWHRIPYGRVQSK